MSVHCDNAAPVINITHNRFVHCFQRPNFSQEAKHQLYYLTVKLKVCFTHPYVSHVPFHAIKPNLNLQQLPRPVSLTRWSLKGAILETADESEKKWEKSWKSGMVRNNEKALSPNSPVYD